MATSHEREEFSKRLRHALRDAGMGALGAIRLAQDFNSRHAGKGVTHQAVQKWLVGESTPTPDKMRTLAGLLGVPIAWLRDGEGKATGSTAAADAASVSYRLALSDQELVKRYRKLSDRQQQAVAEIITELATKDSRR